MADARLQTPTIRLPPNALPAPAPIPRACALPKAPFC